MDRCGKLIAPFQRLTPHEFPLSSTRIRRNPQPGVPMGVHMTEKKGHDALPEKKGRGHKWTVRELESIPTAWAKDSIADGGGLTGQVRVVNGTAAVAFRYSFKWDGRKVWYYCGNWPTVDLVTIRERRDNARALVAKGVDPRRQKVADKIEAQLKVEQVISEESQRRAHDLSVKDLYDAWISEAYAVPTRMLN